MRDPARLRLLVVTPRYLPYIGGVEHHVREVVRRLSGRIDITLLTADATRQLPPEEDIDGARVLRVPAWPSDRDYQLAPGIAAIVGRGEWDLMHLQSYHTAVAPTAMAAAVRHRVPFVVTFHGGGHSSRLRNLLRGPQRAMLRPLLARADRLVAVAEFEVALYSRMLRIPRERFVVIPNGSDLPAPSQLTDTNRDTCTKVISSVGRLERYKGHQRAIAAMPHVLTREPEAKLQIIGSGPYEDDLRRLAGDLGVADRVTIRSIPPSDRAQMASALADSELMVLLSEFETHPLAVVEAVALGTPALVADTSGLSELAQNGLATAVPLESDPAAVADAMVRLLREPRSVPRIDLPRWDDCAEALADLYRDVAGAHAVASGVGGEAG